MVTSEINYDSGTIVDLENDSITPEVLLEGETAHDATGASITGTMHTVPDSAKLGGKPPEYYLPAVNLLDNSDWRIKKNIINQRGQETFTGAETTSFAYFFDRWLCRTNGNTATLAENGLSIVLPTESARSVGIRQPHQAADFAGKTVTLAAKFRQVAHKAYLAVTNSSKSSTWGTNIHTKIIEEAGVHVLTVDIPETLTNNLVNFFVGDVGATAGTLEVEWAALYEGTYTADTLPPYVPPDPTLELAKCQRYVYAEKPAAGYETSFAYGYSNGTFCRVIKTLPVPQHLSKPSIHSDGITWKVWCNGQQYDVTSMYVMESSGNRYMLQVDISGSVFGHNAVLTCSGDGTIVIDSDL